MAGNGNTAATSFSIEYTIFYATISGTITDSDSSSAIAGAAVQLKSAGNNIGSPVYTDADGAYTISGVPAGTYTLEVSAEGYDSGTISNVVVADANISGKDLMLTKTFIPVADITMTNAASVPAGSNLSLEGTVTPANASRQTIVWELVSAGVTGATVVDGVFSASSAGTATVRATVIKGLSESSDYTRTFTITVTAGPLTGNVTISGTLKYGQTLTAVYEPGNNTGTLSYQWKRGGIGGTDIGVNSDTYTLVKEDIGETILCVVTSNEQTGFVVGSSTGTIGKADGLAITGVTAVPCSTPDNNDGKLIGVTSAMEFKKVGDASYTAVSVGTITVSGSAITASGSAINVSGSAITIIDGAIIGLTDGEYLVRFAATDTHEAGPASSFTVAAFTPIPTYSISGIITDSDNNSPIAGAMVQLRDESGNVGSAVFTDSSGAYTITGIYAGTYSIVVSADGYDSGTISSVVVADTNISGKDMNLTKIVTFIPVTDITMTNTASVQAAV